MASRKKLLINRRGATDVDIEIGKRIRLARLQFNLSQAEVAEALGVTFQQIQKYEKGVNRITVARMMTLAVLLETSPHELMGWDGRTKVPALIDGRMLSLWEEFKGVDLATVTIMRQLAVSIKNGNGARGRVPKAK